MKILHPATAVALTISAAALSGCYSNVNTDRSGPTFSSTGAQGQVQGRPSFSMPIPLPGQSTSIVPFAIEDRKGWFQSDDPFSRGGYADTVYRGAAVASASVSPYYGGSSRWHNAIVHDMKSGEEWPILTTRGVISRYELFARRDRPDQNPVSVALVFIATVQDSNADGSLDDRDASVAIVTDGDGRRPRPVTPPRAQVWSTAYDARLGLLYLYVIADTNSDGQYTPDDSPMPYVFDPRTDGPAQPLISPESRARVESLLK